MKKNIILTVTFFTSIFVMLFVANCRVSAYSSKTYSEIMNLITESPELLYDNNDDGKISIADYVAAKISFEDAKFSENDVEAVKAILEGQPITISNCIMDTGDIPYQVIDTKQVGYLMDQMRGEIISEEQDLTNEKLMFAILRDCNVNFLVFSTHCPSLDKFELPNLNWKFKDYTFGVYDQTISWFNSSEPFVMLGTAVSTCNMATSFEPAELAGVMEAINTSTEGDVQVLLKNSETHKVELYVKMSPTKETYLYFPYMIDVTEGFELTNYEQIAKFHYCGEDYSIGFCNENKQLTLFHTVF